MAKFRKWQRTVLASTTQDYYVRRWVFVQGASWPKAWRNTKELSVLARLAYYLPGTAAYRSIEHLLGIVADIIDQDAVQHASSKLRETWRSTYPIYTPDTLKAAQEASFPDGFELRVVFVLYWQCLSERNVTRLVAIFAQLEHCPAVNHAALARFRAHLPLPPLRPL